ncbi:hypothetical protein MSG28_004900 [Choristoneura fumiferana]|uniref:Uncharacterized protein n=1 Tax=Choristoneura fumiferana TaxID=7141 RepID=A0ACC0JP59_CHOFU|nr:hypothetical protein MSG28_004900 [Choristoneura fumiferana]
MDYYADDLHVVQDLEELEELEQEVENVNALLLDIISSLTRDAAALTRRTKASAELLTTRAAALAAPAAARAQLLQDVKPPLQALQGVNDGNNPASALLALERRVTELIAAVCSAAGPAAAHAAARQLTEQLPDTYTRLIEFPARWAAETGGRRLVRQAAVGAGTRHGGGERNAQGAGVWKRVRLKLEARDPDASRAARAQEQAGWRGFERAGPPPAPRPRGPRACAARPARPEPRDRDTVRDTSGETTTQAPPTRSAISAYDRT